jgi:TolB protein
LSILSACKENPISSGRFPTEAGPILFVSDKSGTYQLYSMNEDGSNVQQLTNDPNFPISDAKWSPDGKKIAVESIIGDERTYPRFRLAIFVMDSDGRNRYQLTKQWFYVDDSTYGRLGYGGATESVWSPDSRQIAYARMMVPEAIANHDVFVINIDGSNERRITASVTISEIVTSWSPNGQLFLANIIDWSILGKMIFIGVLSLRGQVQRAIPSDSVSGSNAIWSPDQNHIAYTSWGGLRHEIFISDEGGNNARILPTTNNTYNIAVDWSIDSQKILFNSSGGKIFVIRQDGNNLTEITPANFTNPIATSWRRR